MLLKFCRCCQALGGRQTIVALEELVEAVHDLPEEGASREEHVDLLDQLKARVQVARAWEASAAELLSDCSPPITMGQLKVHQCCACASCRISNLQRAKLCQNGTCGTCNCACGRGCLCRVT